MEQNVTTAVLLPVALGVIMLGLGLSLTLADFKRVIVYPKAVAIGLGCQMLILPAVVPRHRARVRARRRSSRSASCCSPHRPAARPRTCSPTSRRATSRSTSR